MQGIGVHCFRGLSRLLLRCCMVGAHLDGGLPMVSGKPLLFMGGRAIWDMACCPFRAFASAKTNGGYCECECFRMESVIVGFVGSKD